MPEITVVIPCYNYGEFLSEAVDSVLMQSFRDFEIIVVDDGSTDPITTSLIADFNRPRTRVIRTQNQGPAAARNTGIRASDAQYVVNLDADDRLHPRFLERTGAVLNDDSERELGFVTTWMRKFGDESEVIKPVAYSPVSLALINSVHGSSLFRREAWEKAEGYRESFIGWEDWNLWLNMVGLGYRWQVIPEELVYYRRHGETRSFRSLENRLQIFEAILLDNAELFRERHPELLRSCYANLVESERLWHEKNIALTDNRTLQSQLIAEQEAHRSSLKAYNRLEEHCRDLEASLVDRRDGELRVLEEYKRLEEYARKLEALLGDRESHKRKDVAPSESSGHAVGTSPS